MTQLKTLDCRRPQRSLAHLGGWLPSSPQRISRWISTHLEIARREPPPRSQLVRDFENMIYGSPEIYMLFDLMLTEVPFSEDPCHRPEITTIDDLLLALDQILVSAPRWSGPDTENMLACPINTILNWPMGTKAGFAAFIRKDVNEHLQRILNHWGDFLKSESSCDSLTSDCWFSPAAMSMRGLRDFEYTYICDPNVPHMGFCSWDEFFTRRFKPGVRPLPFAPDEAQSLKNRNAIVNACESVPYALQYEVALRDRFWLKGQPYSLIHMLDDQRLAKEFEKGTVYQAYLSADSYHRWHAPVSGRVVQAKVVQGAYYSEPLSHGFDPDLDDYVESNRRTADPAACNGSQGYLTSVATRGVLIIDSTAPDIGLVGMVLVGMGDVSSVDFTVTIGNEVVRGDELGMFHYGGSTWCLLLRQGVDVKFESVKSAGKGRVAMTDAIQETQEVNALLGSVLNEHNC